MRGPKRSGVAGVTAMVAACALALAGCGGGSSSAAGATADDPVELTMWAWQANLQAALDIWNEENPGIQVTLETLPADLTTAYQKIFAGVKSGTAADILPVEYMALPNYLAEDALADLGDLAADQESAYSSAAWNQVLVDGSPYALPGDIGPIGMYYNATALEEYGYQAPATWEEFEQIGLDINAKTDGQVYIGAMTTNPNNFVGLSWQAGAHWWTRDGDAWRVNIDDAATQQVAQTWQRMVDEGIVWVWDNETVGQQMVADGQILTVLNPSWWAPNLINMDVPDGTFGVTTLPQWDGSALASANSGGSAWGVTASSSHPQEAVEFLTWFTQSPEAYSAVNDETSFSYPASLAQVEVAKQKATPFVTPDGSGDVFAQFAASAEQVPADWQWSPTTIATLTSVQDELGRLAPGSDLPGSVTSLQSTAVEQLTDQGFTVTP
ncbi:extracellular solute-binding protein [Actinotalea sp. M2MS4P-6]|uniref:ABC transporter substrate-binding protein n=1 Tax=Actinotalea sp. M2MS4P-6 TaxID=2983762 RepID=UPI0021E3D2F8|nr:extracellular solute-binding protein [Actinotalea sp. M2MS4P-6]MCV2394752.1 extracellular solute-binding protein [Actinotalea sp. M2MS4P-6]